MKTVGETTRPFNYDLSHIPYNYIRKSQIVIRSDRVPEELWKFMTLYKRQLSRPSPRKKKAKWLAEEALLMAEKRRERKAKEKRKDIPI